MVITVTDPDPAAVADAVSALARGELIVIPTETVYGLAADADNPAALKRLYDVKDREEGKPVASLISNTDMIEHTGIQLSNSAKLLAEAFWPGPLTLILPSGGGFRGFRMPDHPVALAVIRAHGRPLAASSANRSGEPDATTVEEAMASLGDSVSVYIDSGPARHKTPSTVVRVDRDELHILREGALTDSDIRAVFRN